MLCPRRAGVWRRTLGVRSTRSRVTPRRARGSRPSKGTSRRALAGRRGGTRASRLREQPRGTVTLGGHSLGGVLAMESRGDARGDARAGDDLFSVRRAAPRAVQIRMERRPGRWFRAGRGFERRRVRSREHGFDVHGGGAHVVHSTQGGRVVDDVSPREVRRVRDGHVPSHGKTRRRARDGRGDKRGPLRRAVEQRVRLGREDERGGRLRVANPTRRFRPNGGRGDDCRGNCRGNDRLGGRRRNVLISANIVPNSVPIVSARVVSTRAR